MAHVVVHPDRQRRGTGASSLAASGDAPIGTGHSEVDLIVTEANEPAVALYRELGFEQVERLTEPPATS
jgi:ribosomal protein S18 acetylase RimI-like enzyme